MRVFEAQLSRALRRYPGIRAAGIYDQTKATAPEWNQSSERNILSLASCQHKGGVHCNSLKRVLPSVCCSHCWGAVMSERNGHGFLWFVMGIGIGAVVGLLYAPQSGEETREILMAKAEEGREYVRNRAQKAREQAESWADRGREMYNAQKEQIRSAVDAGRQAYREKTTVGRGDGENI